MRDGVCFDRRVNLYISLATCFNATIGKSQHILGIRNNLNYGLLQTTVAIYA